MTGYPNLFEFMCAFNSAKGRNREGLVRVYLKAGGCLFAERFVQRGIDAYPEMTFFQGTMNFSTVVATHIPLDSVLKVE